MRRQGAPLVPERDLVHCDQCGDAVDARAVGVAQQVRGWRVNRAQGGANMIALAEPLRHWLCPACLDKRRGGQAWDQLALWEP